MVAKYFGEQKPIRKDLESETNKKIKKRRQEGKIDLRWM